MNFFGLFKRGGSAPVARDRLQILLAYERTGPATWKYRAMYIESDELVGQWSGVASIAVS